MDDPLAEYLHDHLTGASHAVELLKDIRGHYEREALGVFAAEMLVDVQADRDTLQELADRIGGDGGGKWKGLAGWLTGKGVRVKVNRGEGERLQIFEALEFLGLGIRGKRDLWRALEKIVPVEPRFNGVDFAGLVARADAQYAKVDQQRLSMVFDALRPGIARRAGA